MPHPDDTDILHTPDTTEGDDRTTTITFEHQRRAMATAQLTVASLIGRRQRRAEQAMTGTGESDEGSSRGLPKINEQVQRQVDQAILPTAQRVLESAKHFFNEHSESKLEPFLEQLQDSLLELIKIPNGELAVSDVQAVQNMIYLLGEAALERLGYHPQLLETIEHNLKQREASRRALSEAYGENTGKTAQLQAQLPFRKQQVLQNMEQAKPVHANSQQFRK